MSTQATLIFRNTFVYVSHTIGSTHQKIWDMSLKNTPLNKTLILILVKFSSRITSLWTVALYSVSKAFAAKTPQKAAQQIRGQTWSLMTPLPLHLAPRPTYKLLHFQHFSNIFALMSATHPTLGNKMIPQVKFSQQFSGLLWIFLTTPKWKIFIPIPPASPPDILVIFFIVSIF